MASAGALCPLSLRERVEVRGGAAQIPQREIGAPTRQMRTAVPLTLTISMLPFCPTTS